MNKSTVLVGRDSKNEIKIVRRSGIWSTETISRLAAKSGFVGELKIKFERIVRSGVNRYTTDKEFSLKLV